ncbi:MAG: ATP-binding cassette domain-containing protein [Candidatus Kaelpia imicola]|nr:ATP-binding cassette domain-containing protein [Candidatus Kaelpia imicola]
MGYVKSAGVREMLEIKNLKVSIEDKDIIKNVSLFLEQDDVMILFGPNGSGKSTLIKTIMGFSGYKLKGGEIIFDSKDLKSLSIDKRVKLGIGIMYQHPPQIRGVRLGRLAEYLSSDKDRIAELSRELSLDQHLEREINMGFSGGEMKRAELFQILLQRPSLLLLDEPESGVDIENISIMGKAINSYLKESHAQALIITHTGYILDYIDVVKSSVMVDGQISCSGKPRDIFKFIQEHGYERCRECKCPSQ